MQVLDTESYNPRVGRDAVLIEEDRRVTEDAEFFHLTRPLQNVPTAKAPGTWPNNGAV